MSLDASATRGPADGRLLDIGEIRVSYVVHLARLDALPLAVVHRLAAVHELSRVVPEACGIVWNTLRAHQVTGAGRHVAVYLDDQIHLEVGVELAAPFAGSGEVVPSATPSGLVASTTHLGPYGRLNEAHAAIHQWSEINGYPLAGPSWEIYGHWQEEWNGDPSKISTEIHYLLAADEISNSLSESAVNEPE